MTTVDPSNYDAMMSIANSDDFGDFSQWPGLGLIRVVRIAEDRFLTTGGYNDKESADANAAKASAVFGKMASLMTSTPVVREGEIVWAFDGDQSLTAGYVRHVIFTYDPEQYEAMMSYVETTTERFRGVSGLQRVRLVHCIEPNKTPRMFSSAVFDNKISADAGQENMRAIMSGMDGFIIDDPTVPGVSQFEKNISVREGEVIWSYYR
tara:strand:+ start:1017 stop:1640 length:624 start_codon:yes stop_codon:yes gene_type:complete